jgi:hypothetical protein
MSTEKPPQNTVAEGHFFNSEINPKILVEANSIPA